MPLAELASSLDIPKATAHRLCSQLTELGFLARDMDERCYIVGPRLRELAFDTFNHDSVHALRHAVLTQLVEDVGETCNFTTLDGASVIYLDRVEAPWPWRLTLESGTHVPLHCTASGKLFLSLMSSERRENLIRQIALPRMTANTLVTQKDLRQECERIARDGYAMDREEFIPGLLAVAVPVLDPQGQVRAAIALHGPSIRLSMKTALSRLPALRAAAKRMTGLL
ncbi:MAG: hypothetical protein RLZZ24_390 [Pseudomonadota bacterium]